MNKKEEIIQTADKLFYEQGYEATSFQRIADTVGISKGNFYYHFKSKDEILDAVIDFRLNKTMKMINTWQVEGNTPKDRVKKFINILVVNQDKIIRYGCPVGTLSTELSKLSHSSREKAVGLFILFKDWLRQQFINMGMSERDAEDNALYLLSQSQGAATIADAFQSAEFLKAEATRLQNWVDTL